MKIKGLIQALGVTLYITFVGLLMSRANDIFGKVPNFLGPITFLLLFSFSALICGLMVFYQPYMLFFSKKKKEAMELVLYTVAWLFLVFVVFLLLAVFLK